MIRFTTKVFEIDRRPEIRLLLCCSRTIVDVANAGRINALIRGKVDWQYLIDLATHHGVVPLLYSAMKSICSDSVPGESMNRLRTIFLSNAVHNLFLARELVHLLRLFEAHGIPAVPYKGPVLAVSVYGDLALRQFGDLDILVPHMHVLRAKDLLIERGYRPEFELAPAAESEHLKTDSEYNFDRENGVHVEIHWRLMHTYYLGVDEDTQLVWEGLGNGAFEGVQVPHIPPEILIVYLCVHGGVKHRWDRLQWLCDVAEVIRVHQDMDWGRAIEWSRTQHVEQFFYVGLLLAVNVLGAMLPARLARRLYYDMFTKLVAHIMAHDLLRLGTCGLKARIAYKLVPNAWDESLFPIPQPVSFLYYLVRPMRVFCKHMKLLLYGNHKLSSDISQTPRTRA